MNLSVFTSGLLNTAPYIIAWTVAVVMAAIMVSRGGGTPERFLLTGACIMLVNSLLIIVAVVIGHFMIQRGYSNLNVAIFTSYFNLVRGLIGLVGIVFLVYAFWVKFKPQTKQL